MHLLTWNMFAINLFLQKLERKSGRNRSRKLWVISIKYAWHFVGNLIKETVCCETKRFTCEWPDFPMFTMNYFDLKFYLSLVWFNFALSPFPFQNPLKFLKIKLWKVKENYWGFYYFLSRKFFIHAKFFSSLLFKSKLQAKKLISSTSASMIFKNYVIKSYFFIKKAIFCFKCVLIRS